MLELKSYWLTILLAVSLELKKGDGLSEKGIKIFIPRLQKAGLEGAAHPVGGLTTFTLLLIYSAE